MLREAKAGTERDRSMHDVCVSIVSFNTAGYLLRCIHSVIATSDNLDVQIVVVDNASTDGSPERVAAAFPSVEIIHNTRNAYFTRANNQAIQAGNARFTLILNADVELLPGTLKALLDYMEGHPEVGAVQPAMVDAKGQMQMIGGQSLSTLAGLRLHTLLGHHLPGGTGTRRYYGLQGWDRTQTRPVEILADTCMLVRQEAIQLAGRYDERFLLYFTEDEWSDRLRANGWELVHYSDATILHHLHQSTSTVRRWRIRAIFARDMMNYFGKKNGLGAALLVGSVLGTELVVTILLSCMKRNP